MMISVKGKLFASFLTERKRQEKFIENQPFFVTLEEGQRKRKRMLSLDSLRE